MCFFSVSLMCLSLGSDQVTSNFERDARMLKDGNKLQVARPTLRITQPTRKHICRLTVWSIRTYLQKPRRWHPLTRTSGCPQTWCVCVCVLCSFWFVLLSLYIFFLKPLRLSSQLCPRLASTSRTLFVRMTLGLQSPCLPDVLYFDSAEQNDVLINGCHRRGSEDKPLVCAMCSL